jgi:hypothetical protein
LGIVGKQVMLDRELAVLYGVETRVVNQAVKRNSEKFPEDFMFELTRTELESLRSQTVILEKKGTHSKYLPTVFCQEGIAMLASVLRSQSGLWEMLKNEAGHNYFVLSPQRWIEKTNTISSLYAE